MRYYLKALAATLVISALPSKAAVISTLSSPHPAASSCGSAIRLHLSRSGDLPPHTKLKLTTAAHILNHLFTIGISEKTLSSRLFLIPFFKNLGLNFSDFNIVINNLKIRIEKERKQKLNYLNKQALRSKQINDAKREKQNLNRNQNHTRRRRNVQI